MRQFAAALLPLWLAGAACARPGDQVLVADPPPRNEIAGVLRVTSTEASVEHRGGRIILIEAPPQTAAGHTTLMAQTAVGLRSLDGRRVRARGSLQGSILWDAEVTPDGELP